MKKKNMIKIIENFNNLEWGNTLDNKMTHFDAALEGRLPHIFNLYLAYKLGIKGFNEDFYWSASPGASASGSGGAWYVNFCYGYDCRLSQLCRPCSVVRSGQLTNGFMSKAISIKDTAKFKKLIVQYCNDK